MGQILIETYHILCNLSGHHHVCSVICLFIVYHLLTAWPLPFLGELQPMASSASVASLVIAVETGLSDEEGSLEQSPLGDKS